MRTSLQKINELVAEYMAPPPEDAPPAELAVRSVVMMAWPMFEGVLPDDSRVIDDALEHIAEQLLELRSDEGAIAIEGQAHEQRQELPAGDG